MTDIEWKVGCIEKDLGVKFPKSYREFLIQQGTAKIAGYTILGIPEKPEKDGEKGEEKEEKEGTILFFRPGDLRRGRFAWVSNYDGRIVGLCSLDNCRYCNLAERKQLENFKGGELRVNLRAIKRETTEFYVAHFVSIPELRKMPALVF